MQESIRAAWFEEFGPAVKVLTVGAQPMPVMEPGQVLVRLEASGVNPSDVKKRAGSFPNLLDGGLVIPHSDGAGVIESVGKGVADSRIGERVWVYQAQYGRRFGTAAEYVAIDDCRVVSLPDDTSFEIGACLGIPGMTAHRCVFADGPVDGQTILVTGGAGRVGHYAIQWARQAGARVITTACEPEDEHGCIEAGADATVSHREPDWAAAVLGKNAGYPVDLTIHFVIVYAMPEAAKQLAIADISDKLATDNLQHRVAHTVPLSEIAHAHELIEQGGFRGCVVLTFD